MNLISLLIIDKLYLLQNILELEINWKNDSIELVDLNLAFSAIFSSKLCVAIEVFNDSNNFL